MKGTPFERTLDRNTAILYINDFMDDEFFFRKFANMDSNTLHIKDTKSVISFLRWYFCIKEDELDG